VDADGNELAGIRLPDLAVPVATHTGWLSRHAATGGAGQVLDMMGMTLPFAATQSEREQRTDPRLSIAERFGDGDAYIAQVRAAAEQLAADRHLVPEDVDVAVELAMQRYDLLTRSEVPIGR
jgi:hypothetical protein